VLLLALEWVNPRHESLRLTWKELITDLFYVGLDYTLLSIVKRYVGADVMIEAIQQNFGWEKVAWFMGLPLPLQAFLISFIFDFAQYWMHRGMHNWYPLWLTHAPHHYITQLNINKGAVGNDRTLPDRLSLGLAPVDALSPLPCLPKYLGVDVEDALNTGRGRRNLKTAWRLVAAGRPTFIFSCCPQLGSVYLHRRSKNRTSGHPSATCENGRTWSLPIDRIAAEVSESEAG
jgi:hypothetical protein